ncbi:nucleotidyltransferase domain-containing protein [Marivirga sp.]|uniref:nucleotidyltransferase family protein n=1 Tax=Marivirga sp. TaxID=2018662 RepID=UPI0025F4A03E|nr:nucleotidyltransferase domain-containing protein [Marivirga sp.]
MSLSKYKIQELKDYFVSKPVYSASIFGSFSRGEENEESDVDILLDLDYSKPIGLQFIQMKIDLEKILNRKVDLLSKNGLDKELQKEIEKDKTLIYERGSQR